MEEGEDRDDQVRVVATAERSERTFEAGGGRGVVELEQAEGVLQAAVHWIRLVVEAVGAVVIAAGIAVALREIVSEVARRKPINFTHVRLTLARYLTLALEFQLAADILSTAVAPSWDRIGQLAAIAVIRTALNFFLIREMKEESAEIEAASNDSRNTSTSPKR